MLGLFECELQFCRGPRMMRSRAFCTSPRPQLSNEVNERRGSTLPPRLTSARQSIHDSQSKTTAIFWLQHWLPEELSRAVAVHDADATAVHGNLHDVIPALAAEHTAKAWRSGTEHSAQFSLHVCLVCPVGRLLKKETKGRPDRGGRAAGNSPTLATTSGTILPQ